MLEPIHFAGEQQDHVREGVDVSQHRGDEFFNRWSVFPGLLAGRTNLVKPWQPSVDIRKALADYTLKRFASSILGRNLTARVAIRNRARMGRRQQCVTRAREARS